MVLHAQQSKWKERNVIENRKFKAVTWFKILCVKLTCVKPGDGNGVASSKLAVAFLLRQLHEHCLESLKVMSECTA
jgi:hypothetical protein